MEQDVVSKFLFVPTGSGGTLDEMGGKGFHLAWMRDQGLSVPPACVISTKLCQKYWGNKASYQDLLKNTLIPEIQRNLTENELFPLVSVRSGAKVSMPGMMDTILNVGLTTKTMPHWESVLGLKAARDSRRRLLQMFGDVVFEIDSKEFEAELAKIKKKRGVQEDCELNEVDLLAVCQSFEKIFAKHGKVMPDTASDQIFQASVAVLNSWNNARAIEYRKMENIPDDIGTAIVVQRMVFGNLNDNSCSGVMFSRDPSTGRNSVIGEFLPNAQGEDVVAGIRTPIALRDMDEWNLEVFAQLESGAKKLERAGCDMQDIEFTVEDGKVWFLQTRKAKRSALAAVKCALDMADENLIDKHEALSRITLNQYEILSAPLIAPSFNVPPDIKGLAASVGIVTAPICFSSAEAEENPGCILVSEETSPEDLPGMRAAAGILTATGGVTSHAAVVARGMDRVCVVGAGPIEFKKNTNGTVTGARIGGHDVVSGDVITLDGAGGRAWVGTSVPVVPGGELKELAALHDLAGSEFPVYRITTDGRELYSDYNMVYATYLLDSLDLDEIATEIRESLPYLTGVVDLTNYSDLSPAEDREIINLMGGSGDDDIFAAKATAVLNFCGENKSKIKVHLGLRESKWKEQFEHNGFEVITSGSASDLTKENHFCICLDELAAKQAVKLAGSGKLRAIAAVGYADADLLERLRSKASSPLLALSSQQILGSILKRKM